MVGLSRRWFFELLLGWLCLIWPAHHHASFALGLTDADIWKARYRKSRRGRGRVVASSSRLWQEVADVSRRWCAVVSRRWCAVASRRWQAVADAVRLWCEVAKSRLWREVANAVVRN